MEQIIVYGVGDEIPDDYIKINTTSRSHEEWSKKFSPFFLGPIKVHPFNDETYTSEIFENAWQYLKRYKSQTKKEWKKMGN